ncbi:metallophosphoesterase [Aliifodinibius sp. S!AR15-10]|uniref:metallophosphoesterase n=1 Tax=Aliifodinibius sp. S!AR15-10 TaxID=2950437 RepID=UPI002855BADF|nr:metallophosphoesterase [Aliifodinibius sp. S!AR15-10]MDR8389604.1 metallophosphoesterase [Aliifodinibius sp. S!AR15-10]
MNESSPNIENERIKKLLQFEQQRMVDWYSPSQLATTGLRAVISAVFGNYADKRELQAALSRNQEAQKPFDFSDRSELWIDYVSDLGSGWDSTYSVAYLLGRRNLTVADSAGEHHDLKRGNILVMGGDEVYPTATAQEYKNRLVAPYTSSLSRVDEKDDPPTLFAIPGNHDWYDGLSSFLKLFCQQRWIGGWKTRQTRSYFAAKLPHNWWLWGIDIQLSSDVDKPQIDYFDQMCKQASAGDRVILCTSEPVWVYQQYQPDDKPYKNLQFFTERYTEKADNKLDFRLMLTGDMHHYTSFKNMDKEDPDWKITAGGGGAFTHPTHQVPDALQLEEGKYEKSQAFPDGKESRRMALNNLKFPFINFRFGALFGFVYLLFGWFMGARKMDGATGSESVLQLLSGFGLSDMGLTISTLGELLGGSPGLVLFLAFLFLGILGFADTNRKKPLSSWIAGAIHGFVQVILLLSAVWLTSFVVFGEIGLSINSLAGILLSAALLALCGWLFSGFAMGLYLTVVTLLLRTHETEAFSSFRGENYKNFVRLYLDQNGLKIYPVKIPTVYKHWVKAKAIKEGEDPWFIPQSGDDLEYGLIENPITIPSK